ncbi:MAG: hypothetical protein M1827_003088 [Pycnora praestabilis]|nr:MAG: hypothetical protein M1827_003088 [Pycnora praestabilis]
MPSFTAAGVSYVLPAATSTDYGTEALKRFEKGLRRVNPNLPFSTFHCGILRLAYERYVLQFSKDLDEATRKVAQMVRSPMVFSRNYHIDRQWRKQPTVKFLKTHRTQIEMLQRKENSQSSALPGVNGNASQILEKIQPKPKTMTKDEGKTPTYCSIKGIEYNFPAAPIRPLRDLTIYNFTCAFESANPKLLNRDYVESYVIKAFQIYVKTNYEQESHATRKSVLQQATKIRDEWWTYKANKESRAENIQPTFALGETTYRLPDPHPEGLEALKLDDFCRLFRDCNPQVPSSSLTQTLLMKALSEHITTQHAHADGEAMKEARAPFHWNHTKAYWYSHKKRLKGWEKDDQAKKAATILKIPEKMPPDSSEIYKSTSESESNSITFHGKEEVEDEGTEDKETAPSGEEQDGQENVLSTKTEETRGRKHPMVCDTDSEDGLVISHVTNPPKRIVSDLLCNNDEDYLILSVLSNSHPPLLRGMTQEPSRTNAEPVPQGPKNGHTSRSTMCELAFSTIMITEILGHAHSTSTPPGSGAIPDIDHPLSQTQSKESSVIRSVPPI